MILKDLCDLYDLKRDSDPDAIPELHWCRKSASWEVLLGVDGTCLACIPIFDGDGKHPQPVIVPDIQRTSGVRPFFLCDNAEYLLGLDEKRGAEKHREFVALHREILGGVDDAPARALLRFLTMLEEGEVPKELGELGQDTKSLVVFRLEGSVRVHECPAVREAWERYSVSQEAKSDEGICLVTGSSSHLAKLFPQVTGLAGAQSSGTSLVSCNVASFSSYGQKTSTAGSISWEAANKAGAALSYVLKDPRHRVRIGSDYVAFWTDADTTDDDEWMLTILDPDRRVAGEDERVRDAVQEALISLRGGRSSLSIPQETQYHVLGIAPYQARLAIRFYETGSIGDLERSVGQFLRDTEMVGVEPCSLKAYLRETAVRRKTLRETDEGIPSSLIATCMWALIHGGPFPSALQMGIVERLKSSGGAKSRRGMGRCAAILKACLMRRGRDSLMGEMLTPKLNIECLDKGYVLGRLFALLEIAQIGADNTINATIRERYMSAAASTPKRVFPELWRLCVYHTKKDDTFGQLNFKRIRAVTALLGPDGFPSTLSLDEQSMFYIGYAQQWEQVFPTDASTLFADRNGDKSASVESDEEE